MTEIWKTIIGYEGIYEISNIGRVKSLSRKKHCGHPGATQLTKERFLKISIDRNGYRRVKLSKDGCSKLMLLHRLVASAFVENPNDQKEVNHIDGNKKNNLPENLEWVNRSENMKHAFKNNLLTTRKGLDNNKTKLNNEKVQKIRSMREEGFTLVHIAKLFDITAANVSEIVNYKTWKEVL